ncbi:hypothetical protein BGZ65_001477, partial [Modicella reniformis]
MRYTSTSPIFLFLLHWSIAVTRAAPASLDAIDLSTKDANARRNILPDGPSISQDKYATGTFTYDTPDFKSYEIKGPAEGTCYPLVPEADGAENATDKLAVLYNDDKCKTI